jgi:hypothetical protein
VDISENALFLFLFSDFDEIYFLTNRTCVRNGLRRNVACRGKMRIFFKITAGRPEENRPLRRLRRIREDNIKISFEETVWEGVDWIYLAQDTDRWRALHGNEPSDSIKVGKFLTS